MFPNSTLMLRTQVATAAVLRNRQKHTVRVILTSNVGQNEKGEVITVKAGYARNFLIPQKMALYAIPSNFQRLNLTDPDIETAEQRNERLKQEAAAEVSEEQIAASILTKYLSNKVLKIWRNADLNTKTVYPGMVDYKALREKLSKQLKIDLDDDEQVHILEDPVVSHDILETEALEEVMAQIDNTSPCGVQIRQLGDFVAKISLAGDYTVPLKFKILKR